MSTLHGSFDGYGGSDSLKARLAMTCIWLPVVIGALVLAFMSRSSAGGGGGLSRLRKIATIVSGFTFLAYMVVRLVQLGWIISHRVSYHFWISYIFSQAAWRLLEIAMAALVSLLVLERFAGTNRPTGLYRLTQCVALVTFVIIAILEITRFGLAIAILLGRYNLDLLRATTRLAFALSLLWLKYAIFLLVITLLITRAVTVKRSCLLISMVLTILLIYHIVASFVNGLALSGSYGLMSADVDIIAALDAEFHVGLIATTAILMLSAMLGMRNFGTHSEQGPKLADNPEVAVNPTDYVYNPVTRQ